LSGRADGRPGPTDLGRPGLRARIERELYHFASGLASVRDPAVSLNVLWSAQATWLAEAVAFYGCGRALDVDLSLGGYLLLVVAANIAGSVPLTQAGIGVFEVTLTGLMVALGVDKAQAAAYAIFVHVLLTAPHVVSGPVAAAALRMRPSDVFLGGGGPDT
ncbi:MAG TPA: lysylphosphatidylglycerol synthase transmembrane domain-containing protein, partial [Dehalococcoidia bacterium]|nr:lysylphosphatidylglycerol synthase transmembrane domain-containing protein [Dehalococcoidia bacterium]